ncbi:MAG: trypsin-like peptidase domain-containing protein, partial [Anaerolineae bacterium]|nr:trypsin-like peptidase domain-containing protein [Anaerolineae bacterium]
MPQSLDESIFRVLNAKGETVGTGFVITSDLAVTCAHVVLAAGCQPGGMLNIRFYKDSADLRVEVLKVPWSPVEGDDITFLRLDELSSPSHPLKLASSAGAAHHLYTSLGFPKGTGQAEARRPSGSINGLIPSQGRRDWLELKGDEMNYGMSGSPILDLALDRVVGMVTYYQDDTFARNVFATTSDTLQSYLKDLLFHEPDALVGYRARLLEETHYVSFSGIPLPTGRDGRPLELSLPLDRVYIRLRMIEDQQQHKREQEEQRRVAEQSSHSLGDVLLLGEYLYNRTQTVNEKDIAPTDPQQALNRHGRLVILGAPGAGKSTLLRW